MILLLACSPAPEPAPVPEKPEVVSLSFPAHWLVQRIAGASVDARCIAPPGEDPPDWRPDPALIASLAEADLIVANGAGYEAWTKTASLPRSRFVDSAEGLELIEREAVAHTHGGSEHSHGELDPHTWSDPVLYAQQAEAVHAGLVGAAPELSEVLDAGLSTLKLELDAIDALLEAAMRPWQSVPVATSHPAFEYLERRYGLHTRALDLDPEEVRELDVPEPWLWWEAQPSQAVMDAIPGPMHLVLDPLEQPGPDGYDWVAGQKANVAALEAAGALR